MGKTEPGDHAVLWDAVRKGLLLAAILIAGNITVYLLAVEHINRWGMILSRELGLPGVGLFSFFVDMIIMPTSVDVLFPLVINWPPIPLLSVMAGFSALGGFSGYWIARSCNRFKYIQKSVAAYRRRGEQLVNRYGPWAVVIAGITPVPFSFCWTAGLLKVHAGWVFLACLSRFPRMVLYYLIFRTSVMLFS